MLKSQCNAKKSKAIFKYGVWDTHLEIVSSYKYLGIRLYASGNATFSECPNDLYSRGLKAFFKLRTTFKLSIPSIQTLVHIFDYTVKPVFTYGSEIWGAHKILSSSNVKSDFIENLVLNSKTEQLHLKFLRYILGVGRKSATLAVLGETGRYPMYKLRDRTWFSIFINDVNNCFFWHVWYLRVLKQ